MQLPRRWSYGLFTLVACCWIGMGFAQPERGYVHIVAAPDVRVFVDAAFVGLTQSQDQGLVLNNIAAGKHQFRFEQQGFKPFTTSLTVTAGEITVYTLHGVRPEAQISDQEAGRTGYLEAQTGTIELACLPVYCQVSVPALDLNDYRKGSGPLKITEVLATSYELEIQVGEVSLRETVAVAPNATLKLFADFTRRQPLLQRTLVRLPVRRVQRPRASASVAPHFAVTLMKPLAVLIDNADAAYPQQGLIEASSVFEMPVEGGLTRLMSVYARDDPAQVGPIRDARDYFLEAALAMNGTLVHVGGAPSTVGRIAVQNIPTLDALQDEALFAQAPDRAAPHNIFSTGTALRAAIGNVDVQVSGTLYTPPDDEADVSMLTVNYSADYTSGFRYLPELDRYRWLRNGTEATDAAQEAVTADTVVVARVVAFPYPDDPEGRLYLPYSGGEATLYLRGKAVPGSWTPENGFTFISTSDVEVDLTPFKSWILFAAEEAQVKAE